MDIVFALEYMIDEEIYVTHLKPDGTVETSKPDYSTSDKLFELLLTSDKLAQISLVKESTETEEQVTTYYQRLGELEHDHDSVGDKVMDLMDAPLDERLAFYESIKEAYLDNPGEEL